ncbi:MAG: hypothetical protein Q9M09_05435, partial [Mariprofundaceae bacterium]|nr:hypothetical protein [Mariprofundaceae bacterium]
MQPEQHPLYRLLTREGPSGSPLIQQQLGLSQPTVSRLIRAFGHRIIRIGKARATRYACLDAHAPMPRMPLYAINTDGVPMQIADLCLLSSGHCYVES